MIFNNFIYASGALGFYGEGYFYQHRYNLPDFPFITKTLTLYPKKGLPFAVFPTKHSIYNKVSLHNPGLLAWCEEVNSICMYYDTEATISIYPTTDMELVMMLNILKKYIPFKPIKVEINLSCPNMSSFYPTVVIPNTEDFLFWLKLNHTQDPLNYNLDLVEGIRLNSKPTKFLGIPCGVSGKKAQAVNWDYIAKYNKYVDISGCSWYNKEDLKYLILELGCKEISIGSVIMLNIKEVLKLSKGIII